jgi:hypothetical protein
MDFITLLLRSPLFDGSFIIPVTFIVRASYSVYFFCRQPQQGFPSLKCFASTGCSVCNIFLLCKEYMSDTVSSLCFIIFCSLTFKKFQKNLAIGGANNLCQCVPSYLYRIYRNTFISATSGIRQHYPTNLGRIKLMNYLMDISSVQFFRLVRNSVLSLELPAHYPTH